MPRNLRDRVKAGGKEGKEQMFWREMRSKEKQDVSRDFSLSSAFVSHACKCFFHIPLSFAPISCRFHTSTYSRKEEKKKGKRKKIIMSPFPFSPPPVHSNFHTVKSFLLFSHFFGKRNKKRERHLNGGQEKGDILLLLLLLLSKLRTSHGDPQNEFYNVRGGSEKTTPLGQMFTHKV